MKKLIVGCLLVLAGIQMAATTPIELSVSPAMSMGPATIRLKMHIERDPSNRQLSWACWDVREEGLATSEDMTLDGEKGSSVYTVELKGVGPGEYVCGAALIRTTGRFEVKSQFTVRGN